MENHRKSTPDFDGRETSGRSAVPGYVTQKPWYKRPASIIPTILAATLLLLCLVIYFYKDRQVQDAQEQAALEQAGIIQGANQRLTQANTYFLELLSMPTSWAIRTALLAGNVDQVDQYLFQFVQQENFELVLVTDAAGKIISSTNQKYIGNQFSDHFEASLLQVSSTTVNNTESNRIKVASPIMGLNSRLGNLFFIYLPEKQLEAQ